MRYAGKLVDRRKVKTMRMQTKLPIVALVGAGALLLVALAVILTLRSQTAFAQNGPTVEIDLNSHNGITKHGQSVAQYTFRNFQDITCEKNAQNQHQHHTAFDDPCYHRSEVYERGTTTDNLAHQCGLGGNRSFSQGDGISKVIGYRNNIISSSCPEGEYTLTVILMGSDKNKVTSETVDFAVVPPPTSTPTKAPTPTKTPTPTPTKKSGRLAAVAVRAVAAVAVRVAAVARGAAVHRVEVRRAEIHRHRSTTRRPCKRRSSRHRQGR